jgi:hypothetical protein
MTFFLRMILPWIEKRVEVDDFGVIAMVQVLFSSIGGGLGFSEFHVKMAGKYEIYVGISTKSEPLKYWPRREKVGHRKPPSSTLSPVISSQATGKPPQHKQYNHVLRRRPIRTLCRHARRRRLAKRRHGRPRRWGRRHNQVVRDVGCEFIAAACCLHAAAVSK